MADANDIREQVTQAIRARSVNAVARDIGIGREALARFSAGMLVRKGTVLVIEQGLARLPRNAA